MEDQGFKSFLKLKQGIRDLKDITVLKDNYCFDLEEKEKIYNDDYEYLKINNEVSKGILYLRSNMLKNCEDEEVVKPINMDKTTSQFWDILKKVLNDNFDKIMKLVYEEYKKRLENDYLFATKECQYEIKDVIDFYTHEQNKQY